MTEQESLISLVKNESRLSAKLIRKPSLLEKPKQPIRGASAEIFQKSVPESILEEDQKVHSETPKIDYRKELVFLFFNNMLEEIMKKGYPIGTSMEEGSVDLFESEPNSYIISVEEPPTSVLLAVRGIVRDTKDDRLTNVSLGQLSCLELYLAHFEVVAIFLELRTSTGSEVEKSKSIPSLSWIVEHKNETGTVIFNNGNMYEGDTFRRIMDGIGTFRWADGTVYKGQFKDGYPTGQGKMILSDLSTYDGDFCQGYFHGSGVLYLSDCLKFYKGSWKSGKRHGKGWIEYGMNDSYVGDWFEDTRHGKGYRKYKNGARYKGQWNENAKHGTGSMILQNKDYYDGEWQQNRPHGYGEYTWNMFLNKTLTFPIYSMYKGNWSQGERHGVGMLYFGTECGSKLAGTWRNNHKHGPGVIVCGNGRIIEYCPLFAKDKPAQRDKERIRKLQAESSNAGEMLPLSYDNSFADIASAIHSKIAMTDFPREILQNIVEGMIAPEKLRVSSVRFIKLPENPDKGKKSYCPLSISIHCVTENVDLTYFINEIFRHLQSFRESSNLSECNIADSNASLGCIRNVHRRDTDEYQIEKSKETKLLQNMITVHLPELRRIYEQYAAVAVSEEQTLNFKPVMVRLFLWQLLRDMNIQLFISLVDYDNFLYANPCSCYEYGPHYPFEHIYFWQFLQCLVAAAWKYYLSRSLNRDDISMSDMVLPEAAFGELGKGFVSRLFKWFLEYVVIPNSDTFKGAALTKYKDSVPLDRAYNLYLSLGEPHTVNMFLYSSCPKEGVQIPCYIGIQFDCESIKDGFNATLLGNKPSYVEVKCTPLEKIIEKDRCREPEKIKTTDEFYKSLYTFRSLGRSTIVKCIHKVCPMVEKPKSFNYKLTFLEFYEILFECAYCKVDLLKEDARDSLRRKLIDEAFQKQPSESASISRGSKVLIKGRKGKTSSRKSLQA